MPLESDVDFLGDLDPNSPGPAEFKSEGDDHFRNLKKALRQSFPGATGPILVMGTATGPADAYVLTPARPLVEYRAGMLVAFQITAANATTAPTLNVSSLGAKTIKAVDGAALVAGDMPANSYQFLLYNGTDFVQQAPSKAYIDRVVRALKDYTDQLAFSSNFPNQSGNAGKVIFTDGTNVYWALPIPAQAGKAGKVLGTNGTTASWRSVLPTVTKFTTSGSWVATSETARITYTGGGGSSAANGQNNVAAPGGAGAGTGIVTLTNLTIGATYTVTIGAGGAAVSATGSTQTDGNAGGTTSFSGPGITTLTATGGSGGKNVGIPSPGGTATGADIVIPGGVAVLPVNGVATTAGGASYFGPGAGPEANGAAFGEGAGPVAGGNDSPVTGRTGAPGVVIIET